MDANKTKALEAALGQIERQFGKGTVMRMGDNTRQAIPAISTGLFRVRYSSRNWRAAKGSCC